ncbi:MAG TPA: hypothetical protein VGI23_25100 [Steroidobacteraceae bacterium]
MRRLDVESLSVSVGWQPSKDLHASHATADRGDSAYTAILVVLAIACQAASRSATGHFRYLRFVVGDTVRHHARGIRKRSRALSLEFAHCTAPVGLTENPASRQTQLSQIGHLDSAQVTWMSPSVGDLI